MSHIATLSTVAQTFDSVKSLNSQLSFPMLNSMIHHKAPLPSRKLIVSYPLLYKYSPYGVSSSRRVLTRSLFIKKFDHIRDCLRQPLGLTTAQREVTLRILRLYAYYGAAYPKESQITEDPGCKKATFWRTIRLLRELGLVQVVNRYVIRPHAQISNLYRLDKLVLVIARYLAEHGIPFLEKWLRPMLTMSGAHFWTLAFVAARETDFEGERLLPSLLPLASCK